MTGDFPQIGRAKQVAYNELTSRKSTMKLLSVFVYASLMLNGAAEEPDFEGTCPFIYDDYIVDIGGVDIDFSPKKMGWSHGYYCSLSTSILGQPIDYTFNNCSCPVTMYCNTEWGKWETSFLGQIVDMHVGKCQIHAYMLLIPFFLAFFLAYCVAKVFTCICYRRREVIYVTPPTEYVLLS